jgi:predicted nucleic acid-binding protein
MVSLDTNILARYLLNDTQAQAIIAEQLLGREPFTVFDKALAKTAKRLSTSPAASFP